MSRLSGLSLRDRLILTLTVALLPVLCLAVLQAIVVVEASQRERGERLLLQSTTAVAILEKKFARADALLATFKDEAIAGECAEVLAELDRVLPSINNVAAFDASGISTCSARGGERLEMSDPAWHEALRDGQRGVITRSFYSEESDAYIFGVIHRVEGPRGRFLGSVALALDVRRLMAQSRSALPDQDVSISLLQTDGLEIGDTIVGTLPADWRLDRADGSRYGAVRTDRGHFDVVTTPVGPDGTWALIARRAPNALAWQVTPVSVIGLPLLIFVLALVASWLATNRLVIRWLKELRRLTVAYGRGDFQQPVEQFADAPPEISGLVRAFERMGARISERDRDLRRALTQTAAANREIHHRIKNNLQIVTSFLSLQSRYVTDQKALALMSDVRWRIDSLSIVHQTLYRRDRLDMVEMQPFFETLLDQIGDRIESEVGDIVFERKIDPAERPADDAIPMGLFVAEVLTDFLRTRHARGVARIGVTFGQKADGTNVLVLKKLEGFEATDPDVADEPGQVLSDRLMGAFARQLGGTTSWHQRAAATAAIELSVPPTRTAASTAAENAIAE